MTRLLSFACAALLIVSASTLGAQAPQPKPEDITVSGCLEGNATANTFMLMTEKEAYELTGGAELKEHVGRRVEIAGTLAGEKKLQVKAIRVLAASCS